MADTTDNIMQHDILSDVFLDKLRKVSQAGETQDRVQRVMLALGYALALTPTGNPGFTRKTFYKGIAVNVWVADVSLTEWPASLLNPVWVGFYTPEEPVEMIQDLEFPRLMDFLQEYHPEAFAQPSELADGEG